MARARLYLVGSLMLVAAGSLAGCGRGWLQFAEREPWRAEAEKACLTSGQVRETANLVRIEPISGPGVCGAEYPLKVAALGESSAIGYVADLRPPGSIPNVPNQPRWPGAQPSYRPSYQPPPQQPRYAPQPYPQQQAAPAPSYPSSQPYPAPQGRPISLAPPGSEPPDEEDYLDEPEPQPQRPAPQMRPRGAPAYPAPIQAAPRPLPALGPARGSVMTTSAVQVKPAATLACPMVSALDKWIVDAVQPAAMRWFNSPVAEIKQISAYSCRGMNGNSYARISEHAFGNALDIASFTLADGRRIGVKEGWRGLPEEQGFLRDVQAAACQQFSTVLAPGSNIYHYDHIHVDLMRRSSGRGICQPGAVSGEEIAARAQRSGRYAGREPQVTGSVTPSLGGRKGGSRRVSDDDWIEDESNIRETSP